MKFNWNWGIGIAVVYSGFVLIRILVIIFSESQGVDLVAPDYYEREIRYEERIEEIRNAKSLTHPVTLQVINKAAQIRFPAFFEFRKIQGAVILFRPSDKRADRVISLKPDSTGLQEIDLSGFSKGYWKIQMLWEYEGKRYYQEHPVFLINDP